MFRTPHTLTDGEKKCLEPYWEETKGQAPRKNLIKLVRHINMFNPVPRSRMRIPGSTSSSTVS